MPVRPKTVVVSPQNLVSPGNIPQEGTAPLGQRRRSESRSALLGVCALRTERRHITRSTIKKGNLPYRMHSISFFFSLILSKPRGTKERDVDPAADYPSAFVNIPFMQRRRPRMVHIFKKIQWSADDYFKITDWHYIMMIILCVSTSRLLPQ